MSDVTSIESELALGRELTEQAANLNRAGDDDARARALAFIAVLIPQLGEAQVTRMMGQ